MTQRPRLLTLMGSGETAPPMARVHRALVERFGSGPVEAVLLETPYGFQENVDEISRRAVDYFGRHLELPLQVAGWRSPADDALQRERALALVARADLVFSGPGSPTHALRAWAGSGLGELLAGKLARGGCVTFGSAAAACLGVATVPVYEIYKAGADPHWVEGLDLLSVVGLPVAVIPHYDNAEGGTHDTRFCYLGQRRLQAMEALLDSPTCVLGVDEHTAAVFDLDAGTVSVLGRGALTIRRAGASAVFGPGVTLGMDELRAAAVGAVTTRAHGPTADAGGQAPAMPSLQAEARRLQRAFDEALRARDIDSSVAAVLELEQAIVDWSADTEEEDGPGTPRALLRRMVVRLGELAALGARDPAEDVAPFVETLLAVRDRARAQRSWELADELRDRLTDAGVQVRDTPEGTSWALERS